MEDERILKDCDTSCSCNSVTNVVICNCENFSHKSHWCVPCRAGRAERGDLVANKRERGIILSRSYTGENLP